MGIHQILFYAKGLDLNRREYAMKQNVEKLTGEAKVGDLIGIRPDIDNDTYHQGPGISSTDLGKLSISPAHYQHWLATKDSTETSDTFWIGIALHQLVLEPHDFDKNFVILEPGQRRTSRIQNTPPIQLTRAQGTVVLGMAAAVNAHPVARNLLRGVIEHSFYWIDPETKLLCKCRPDCINLELNVIVDLKSCSDASYEGFKRAIGANRYFAQDAYYRWGVSEALKQSHNDEFTAPTGFVFVAVEKIPPYEIGLYSVEASGKELGLDLVKSELKQIRKCTDSGCWPGYPQTIQEIAMRSYDHEHYEAKI